MAITTKMLEELRSLFASEGINVSDEQLLEAGLAIANYVLIRQMKDIERLPKSE